MTDSQVTNTVEAFAGDEFIFADTDAELLMACCDCGLTHTIKTRVEDDKVIMRLVANTDITRQIREEAGQIDVSFGEWVFDSPNIEGWWWVKLTDGEFEGIECMYVYKTGKQFHTANTGNVKNLPPATMWCPAVQPPTENLT